MATESVGNDGAIENSNAIVFSALASATQISPLSGAQTQRKKDAEAAGLDTVLAVPLIPGDVIAASAVVSAAFPFSSIMFDVRGFSKADLASLQQLLETLRLSMTIPVTLQANLEFILEAHTALSSLDSFVRWCVESANLAQLRDSFRNGSAPVEEIKQNLARVLALTPSPGNVTLCLSTVAGVAKVDGDFNVVALGSLGVEWPCFEGSGADCSWKNLTDPTAGTVSSGDTFKMNGNLAASRLSEAGLSAVFANASEQLVGSYFFKTPTSTMPVSGGKNN